MNNDILKYRITYFNILTWNAKIIQKMQCFCLFVPYSGRVPPYTYRYILQLDNIAPRHSRDNPWNLSCPTIYKMCSCCLISAKYVQFYDEYEQNNIYEVSRILNV